MRAAFGYALRRTSTAVECSGPRTRAGFEEFSQSKGPMRDPDR